jgi:hypothetical protein
MNVNDGYYAAVSCVESFYVDLVENKKVSPEKLATLACIDYGDNSTLGIFNAALNNLTFRYQIENSFELYKVCMLNDMLPLELVGKIAESTIESNVKSRRLENLECVKMFSKEAMKKVAIDIESARIYKVTMAPHLNDRLSLLERVVIWL